MKKKPFLMRLIFAVIFIAVFSIEFWPPQQKDFFQTFINLTSAEKKAEAQKIVKKAQEIQAESKDTLASQALIEAATDEGVSLNSVVRGKSGKKLFNNNDVVSFVRNAARPSIRRGLDLSGGVEFMLKATPVEGDEPLKSSEIDAAIEALRTRLESQGINEAEISSLSNSGIIMLRAPLATKEESNKILQLIQMSARLEFRLVKPWSEAERAKYFADPKGYRPPGGYQVLEQTEERDGKIIRIPELVKIKPAMKGDNIQKAYGSLSQTGAPVINLQFNQKGTASFKTVTTENTGRQLAIVLDGKLYCAPRINEPIAGGQAVISGNFSQEETKLIANALNAGSLKFKVDVVSTFATDPTLGTESIKSGIWAGIYGLIAIIAFMVLYYWVGGLIAGISLVVNMMLILGAMAAFDATLTLPGIAGIVLTIGMAVDANVLIFERIREEMEAGKTFATSLSAGFSRAFTTILDANLTTLLTAIVLISVGRGAVKGFAIALSIGIATSMFSTLFLSRLLFDIIGNIFSNFKMKMFNWFKIRGVNFIRMSRITGVISILLIISSLVIIGVKGKNIFNVDLTGGLQVTMSYKQKVDSSKVEKVLQEAGYKNIRVSYKTQVIAKETADSNVLDVIISDKEAKSISDNHRQPDGKAITASQFIEQTLNKVFPNAKFSGNSQSAISGLVGDIFKRDAILAIGLALLGVLIYITLRFEMAYAVASIVALAHDVLIAMGIYLACGYQVSLPVIAAILTIIGYSLNDTIVVFDRIRENLGLLEEKSYNSIINMSINRTLSRTILTSFTTFLVLIILLAVGGLAIRDFVFAMLLGVIVGTYSSIFIASPLVSVWHKPNIHDAKKDEDIANDPTVMLD